LKFQIGKLYGEAFVAFGYDHARSGDIAGQSPIYSAARVAPETFAGVKYTFDSGVILQFGKGASQHLMYNGDAIPWATVNGDGFIDYSLGNPPQMDISIAFKGAYLAIFDKGNSPLSEIDSSNDTSRIGYNHNGEVEYVIPRAVAGWTLMGPISPGFEVMYQKKTIKNVAPYSVISGIPVGLPPGPGPYVPTTIIKNADLVSWGVGGNFMVFMSGLMARAHVFAAQNIADMDLGSPFCFAEVDNTTLGSLEAKIANTRMYGGNVTANYRIGDFEPRVGFGYRVLKNKNFTKDDPQYSAYALVAYYLTPGVSIQPGVQYINQMSGPNTMAAPSPVTHKFDDVKQGKIWYYGIFFEACI
jgi:hypothetical protein